MSTPRLLCSSLLFLAACGPERDAGLTEGATAAAAEVAVWVQHPQASTWGGGGSDIAATADGRVFALYQDHFTTAPYSAANLRELRPDGWSSEGSTFHTDFASSSDREHVALAADNTQVCAGWSRVHYEAGIWCDGGAPELRIDDDAHGVRAALDVVLDLDDGAHMAWGAEASSWNGSTTSIVDAGLTYRTPDGVFHDRPDLVGVDGLSLSVDGAGVEIVIARTQVGPGWERRREVRLLRFEDGSWTDETLFEAAIAPAWHGGTVAVALAWGHAVAWHRDGEVSSEVVVRVDGQETVLGVTDPLHRGVELAWDAQGVLHAGWREGDAVRHAVWDGAWGAPERVATTRGAPTALGDGFAMAVTPDGLPWFLFRDREGDLNAVHRSLPVQVEPAPPTPPASPSGGTLEIVEIAPDPAHVPDESGEWIEVVNRGDVPIALEGWVLVDEAGNQGTLVGPEVGPGERRVIGRRDFADPDLIVDSTFGPRVALNNDGDRLTLFGPGGWTADVRTYPDTDPGEAWSQDEDGAGCATAISPGASGPDCP